jgi:hypothetical protein
MRMLRLLTVAGLATLAASSASLAQNFVAPVQGPDCRAMMAQYGPRGLWVGRFSGGREVEPFMFSDATIIQRHAVEACFRTRAECDRWLYALNTQFQDRPELSVCFRMRR